MGGSSDLECTAGVEPSAWQCRSQDCTHAGEGANLAGAQGANGRAWAHGIPLRQAAVAPEVGRQLGAVHLEELCSGLQLHQRAVQGLLEVGILCLGRILQCKRWMILPLLYASHLHEPCSSFAFPLQGRALPPLKQRQRL